MVRGQRSGVLRKTSRFAPWLTACLALASCAAFPQARRSDCDPSSLLREARRLAALSADYQAAEVAGARESFRRTGAACDRFQLALATFSSASRRDDAYAAQLVEDYLASSPKEDPLGGLGALLLHAFENRLYDEARVQAGRRDLTDERTQLSELRGRLNEEKATSDSLRRELAEERAKAAESKRRQASEDRGRVESLSRQLAEEQAKAETLRHQLEELKSIERIMHEREKR